MTKQVPQNESILEIVARFPDGASTEEILVGLQPAPSRRTLQYRLHSLVKNGKLIAEGRTKGRKYRLALDVQKHSSIAVKDAIPLSAKAKNAQLLVTRPIQMRQPVSYHREFLDQYRPNSTSYLSEEVKTKLLKLGRTDGDFPAGTYARQIFNRLLIDLSWNSSRLEGNTYSLLETERLLKSGEATAGKDQRETQMILNHKAAIEFLVESASDSCLNRYTILNLYHL